MIPKGHKRGCRCVVCKNFRKGRAVRKNHGYENQMGAAMRAISKNSTVPMGGTARTGRANRRAAPMPAGNPSDPHLVEELVLYAENTGELYPMIQGVQRSLLTKQRRGDFDFLKAGKAWMRVMNEAARMYTRELRAPGPHGTYGQFSSATRSAAAGRMMSHFSTQAASGELDYLLPKKNPAHYPRTARGPKGTARWYILDLYNGRGGKVSTRIQKGAQAKLETEAAGLVNRRVGNHLVRKVELSGPYARKPTASTKRK